MLQQHSKHQPKSQPVWDMSYRVLSAAAPSPATGHKNSTATNKANQVVLKPDGGGMCLTSVFRNVNCTASCKYPPPTMGHRSELATWPAPHISWLKLQFDGSSWLTDGTGPGSTPRCCCWLIKLLNFWWHERFIGRKIWFSVSLVPGRERGRECDRGDKGRSVECNNKKP